MDTHGPFPKGPLKGPLKGQMGHQSVPLAYPLGQATQTLQKDSTSTKVLINWCCSQTLLIILGGFTAL